MLFCAFVINILAGFFSNELRVGHGASSFLDVVCYIVLCIPTWRNIEYKGIQLVVPSAGLERRDYWLSGVAQAEIRTGYVLGFFSLLLRFT